MGRLTPHLSQPCQVRRPPRALAVGLDDFRAVSGTLHRSTALLRGCHRVVGLAHDHDLTVAGLQPEPELASLVLIHLGLACRAAPLHSLLGIGRTSASAIRADGGQLAQYQPGRAGPLRNARIPQPDVADELTDLLGHIAALNDRCDGTVPSGSCQQLMERYAELVQRSEEAARRNAQDKEPTPAAISMAFTACTALTELGDSP